MKEWKINSPRKDPRSGMRCKICKGKPTRWYKLMSTTVYRCEQHKREVLSPVYDQGRISSNGELIGMEINKTFEVGIAKVPDMKKEDVEALKNELFACKDIGIVHELISKTDPDWESKLKKLVHHIKEKHPLLYKYHTRYDSDGEHNLWLEDPDQYFMTQQSQTEILNYYKRPIPKELVGTDVSSADIQKGVFNIGI